MRSSGDTIGWFGIQIPQEADDTQLYLLILCQPSETIKVPVPGGWVGWNADHLDSVLLHCACHFFIFH